MSKSNIELYKESFIESFSLDKEFDLDKLEFNQIDEWDSIGHMTLISELEEKFSISIDTDDVIDFSSFVKGKEILSKYKVIID